MDKNLLILRDGCWQQMLKDSSICYQYILDHNDEERLITESTKYEQAKELLSQRLRVSTALDDSTPPQVLPVAPPPLLSREPVMTQTPAIAPPPPPTPLLADSKGDNCVTTNQSLISVSNASQTLPLAANSNLSYQQ